MAQSQFQPPLKAVAGHYYVTWARWLFDESPEHSVRMGVRGGGCSLLRTSLFPANWEKQGDSGELQRGAKRNPDKSRQISIVWMEVSLLKEQGDYHSSAGT
jgi:hypothetical protein